MHRWPQYTRNGGSATCLVHARFWPGNGQVDRVEAWYAWHRSWRAVESTGTHFDIFIAPNGAELIVIGTDEGFVLVRGPNRRVSHK